MTGDVTEMGDSFTFDLMDKKPNHVPDNEFHIMWSVISFEHPVMNITESAGVIRIPVTRTGNLKQVSHFLKSQFDSMLFGRVIAPCLFHNIKQVQRSRLSVLKLSIKHVR